MDHHHTADLTGNFKTERMSPILFTQSKNSAFKPLIQQSNGFMASSSTTTASSSSSTASYEAIVAAASAASKFAFTNSLQQTSSLITDKSAATSTATASASSLMTHPFYIDKIFNFQNMFLFSNPSATATVTASQPVTSSANNSDQNTSHNGRNGKRNSEMSGNLSTNGHKSKKKCDFSIDSILSPSATTVPVPSSGKNVKQQQNMDYLSMFAAQHFMFHIQQQQLQQPSATPYAPLINRTIPPGIPPLQSQVASNRPLMHSTPINSGSVSSKNPISIDRRRNPSAIPTSTTSSSDAQPVVKVKNAKKYKCDLCGRGFSRSNTLITHRRIHTGEKPFECNICGRAFRQPGNLTRHKLTHTTIKPYSCNKCGKSFNRVSNLHAHIKIHSDGKPFVCIVCSMGFYQKIDLKVHSLTHTNGNKLHECNICKRKFKQAAHLKYHLHSHLKQIPTATTTTANSMDTPAYSSDVSTEPYHVSTNIEQDGELSESNRKGSKVNRQDDDDDDVLVSDNEDIDVEDDEEDDEDEIEVDDDDDDEEEEDDSYLSTENISQEQSLVD